MLYKVKEFGCDIARKLLSNRAKALVQELYLRRVRRQAAGLHSRQESLWQAIREKAVINVVFEMYHLGFWRSESLFRQASPSRQAHASSISTSAENIRKDLRRTSTTLSQPQKR